MHRINYNHATEIEVWQTCQLRPSCRVRLCILVPSMFAIEVFILPHHVSMMFIRTRGECYEGRSSWSQRKYEPQNNLHTTSHERAYRSLETLSDPVASAEECVRMRPKTTDLVRRGLVTEDSREDHTHMASLRETLSTQYNSITPES